MARILLTVDDLVEQVRSQMDENSRDSLDTELDILPALNRAQDFAVDIYCRYYAEPFLAYETITTTGGTAEYDIPEGAFEDRLARIEVVINQSKREVQRLSYRNLTNYESAARSNIPYYYAILGRKFRLVPTPSGTATLRVWYIKNPERLVLQQGRITVLNEGSNYLTVDSLGSSITTQSDELGSYFNVIDGQTGEIKGTFQVQSIAGDRVTIRTSPLRTSVLNRTIGTTLSGLSIEVDDYICAVEGTCVPYFTNPTMNFLIQYAVAENMRRLGGPADMELRVLENLEKQVQRTWACTGREQKDRVERRSRQWGVLGRQYYWY